MDLGLTGKSAIVTGASRGIGKAIALALAAEGAHVLITARGQSALDEAVTEISEAGRESGGLAIGVTADASLPETAPRLALTAKERFGSIDILVNNAGGQRRRARFDDLVDQDFLDAFADNVLSVVWMVRAVLPEMRSQKWGRIINIVSEMSMQPDRVSQHYNAAKAAQLNLTKSLSKALGIENILVNAVAPGLIATPGNEEDFARAAKAQDRTVDEVKADFFRRYKSGLVLKRSGESAEVAAVVAFLASELSSYVTGSNFRVDGGVVEGIN